MEFIPPGACMIIQLGSDTMPFTLNTSDSEY